MVGRVTQLGSIPSTPVVYLAICSLYWPVCAKTLLLPFFVFRTGVIAVEGI